MTAIDSAQPRPRPQESRCRPRGRHGRPAARRRAAGSTPRSDRPVGSPTPAPRAVDDAAEPPCAISTFPGDRSPWTQAGGPDQSGSRSASCQAALAAAVSTSPWSCSDRGARRSVARRQGHAAARRRRAVGIDPAQRGDERGQIRGQQAGFGNPVDVRVLALEPAVDRPGPGIGVGGTPFARGMGMATGSARREPRQPPMLQLDVADRSLDPRKAARPMRSPSRYMALSVPLESTGAIASSAHCGNCVAINPRTSRTSVWTSFGCIVAAFTLRSLTGRRPSSIPRSPG